MAAKRRAIPFDVVDAWKRIKETVLELDPDESRTLPEGVANGELERAEQEIGVTFPAEFKQSYMLHDGSNEICVCPNASLMPLKVIVEMWRTMCEIGEEFEDERTNPEGPIRNVHWHPKWIPIADNGGGDHVCLDFAPKKGGTIGQVIDWGHELGPERVLASSFAEYLVELPAVLRTYHAARLKQDRSAAREDRERFSQHGCWGTPKLAGKTLYFTGNFMHWQVEQAVERVEAEEGRMAKRMSSEVDYLVVGEVKKGRPCPEERQAAEFIQQGAAIEILDEDGFSALLSPTREELLAVLLSRPDRDRWNWLGGVYRRIPLPDLSGIDLRGVDLSELDLQGINLTGADLRDANLRGAAINVVSGKLDGACLVDSMPRELMNSSLKRADLSEANLNTANLDGADLTEAVIRNMSSPWWRAVGANFHAADLTGCCLNECTLNGANFSAATLVTADLEGADLTGCDLSGAILEVADLTEANLSGAKLTGANLRRANLACVDLRQSTLDGADFTGANTAGVQVDDSQLAKAIGFAARNGGSNEPGPAILRLAEVAGQTKDLEILMDSALDGGCLGLQFHAGTFGANGYQWTKGVEGHENRSWPFPRRHVTVEACLRYWGHKWSRAVLDFGSTRIKSKGCPLKGKELKELAIAAFREAFKQ